MSVKVRQNGSWVDVTSSTNLSVQNLTAQSLSVSGIVTATSFVGDGTNLPGTIISYASTVAPTGYLECNGAAISRTTYASLFSGIGTVFGNGNGSTTFNIPDLRGEFIRGWDNTRGVDTGRVFGSAQADEFKTHQHQFGGDDQVASQGGYTSLGSFSYDANSTTSGSGQHMRTKNDTTNSGGTETRPRNIALLICIKY